MKASALKVSLIGVGNMGIAIGEKVLQEGFELTVYNRTSEKAQGIIKMGAKFAKSIAEASNDADIIITSLFDDKALISAAKEILRAIKPGAIHIETSTILPATAKELTQLHNTIGSVYVGGAVLGVPNTLRARSATTLAAGPSDIIELCEPIFRSYSGRIIYIGEEPYKSNVMKICSNYLLMTTIQCMGELYTFAEKSELDVKCLNEFLHSVFANKSFVLYADKIKDQSFSEVNFSLDGGYKDVSLFEDAFNEIGVAPELISLIKNKFVVAKANGLAKKDWSAFTQVTKMQAGLCGFTNKG